MALNREQSTTLHVYIHVQIIECKVSKLLSNMSKPRHTSVQLDQYTCMHVHVHEYVHMLYVRGQLGPGYLKLIACNRSKHALGEGGVVVSQLVMCK